MGEAIAFSASVSTADEAAGEGRRDDLQTRVLRLAERYREIWWSTPSAPPEPREVFSPRHRQRSAKEAARLIDDLGARVRSWPEGADERRRWRRETEARVRAFGSEHLAWPNGYGDLVLADEFLSTTRDFLRQARSQVPSLSANDLGQALRNVWIANSLQMIFGWPVELTPGILAYSLLYPLTDNLLDDPTTSKAQKVAFNRALGQRLRGELPEAEDSRWRLVFDRVGHIEGTFPRLAFPEVHGSLLAIHRAQVESLRQQREGLAPFEADLLGISLRKGGSSVLADGWLLQGALTPEQEDFCFGYGVFLQLLDDLQDIAPDRRAGHRTLFSVTDEAWPLDSLTSRLYRFIERVLEEAPVLASPTLAAHKDLIRRNCLYLLMGAVAEVPRLHTRAFRSHLQAGWPLSFRAMNRLRRRAEKQKKKTTRWLRKHRGGSAWEWLEEGADL